MSNTEHIEIILSFVKKINRGYLYTHDDWMELEVIGEDVFTYKFIGNTYADHRDSRYLTITEVSVITPETESEGKFNLINFNDSELSLLSREIGMEYSNN